MSYNLQEHGFTRIISYCWRPTLLKSYTFLKRNEIFSLEYFPVFIKYAYQIWYNFFKPFGGL